LTNYTLNFDFYSANYTGWVVGISWRGTWLSANYWSSNSGVYFTPGTWQTFHATFGPDNNTGADFLATNIGIYMAVEGVTVSGPVYIDNMYLSH